MKENEVFKKIIQKYFMVKMEISELNNYSAETMGNLLFKGMHFFYLVSIFLSFHFFYLIILFFATTIAGRRKQKTKKSRGTKKKSTKLSGNPKRSQKQIKKWGVGEGGMGGGGECSCFFRANPGRVY